MAGGRLRRLNTPEAREAAAFLDRLDPPTRLYLLEMLYRVVGVAPPDRLELEAPDAPLPANVTRLRPLR